MILVTVGTHAQGFNRLIRAMDELAAELDERVIIQRGSSTYEPYYAEHFRFTGGQHMEQLMSEARIIVSHAAAGSIIIALRQAKPLVVVPRLQQFAEHIDDHQQQLARAIAAAGNAVSVANPTINTLRDALAQVTQLKNGVEGSAQLSQYLRNRLVEWNMPKQRSSTPKVKKF